MKHVKYLPDNGVCIISKPRIHFCWNTARDKLCQVATHIRKSLQFQDKIRKTTTDRLDSNEHHQLSLNQIKMKNRNKYLADKTRQSRIRILNSITLRISQSHLHSIL